MKKALIKDSIKEIKNTYKRFLSILLMAFLGVGFFAGIRATSPDMIDTIDKFYKDQNFYDIQIISTLGLTDEDIEELQKIENVEQVVGTYETDAQLEIDNKQIVTKVMCIENINKPVLIEGQMPQKEDECLVEKTFLESNNKKIGDTIELEIENSTNDDGEEVQYLKQKELKIVGIAQSPAYISRDRGTSKLGAGKVNYYVYISKDNINATQIYTNIYIKVENSNIYKTSTNKYEDYIENVKSKINEIKTKREEARYNSLIEIATKKVDEAQNTLNEEKEKAQKQIEDAENKIIDGKNKIEEAKQQLNTNKQKSQSEFSKAEKQIKNAQVQLSNQEKELLQKEQEANIEFEKAEEQKQDLQKKLEEVNLGIQQIKNNISQIEESLKNPNLTKEQREKLQFQKQALEQNNTQLETNKKQIEQGILQIENSIKSGKQEIENAKTQINEAKKQLLKEEQQFNNTKTETNKQINEAEKQLENSIQEITQAQKELDENKQEFENKIIQAEGELIDSRQKIADIDNAKWYVLDRYSNLGYNSFIQDTQSINNIGKVFPVVFFVVATLISLTSMTRMVEEQRTQIGTFKALGYNKIQISSKYVIYASLACIIGSIFGMSVGFYILPKIIWKMYSMMYQITQISISFNVLYGLIGLLLISICIIGATIYSVMKELKYTPATLMRPKSPKMGKRVLLERINFVWRRLSFSKKVTIRNIFRYKKRVLMTIIGILGCTSLILTGFSIKDSISNILPNQFGKVFNYDMQITLKDGLEETQKQQYIEKLEGNENFKKIIETYMTSGKAINKSNEEDVQIIIPNEENDLEGIINLNDILTKEKISMKENEICLTDKTAQLLQVKAGDSIILRDSEDKEVEVKISNIVENYIMHYVYMSKTTYESLYGTTYKTNTLLTQNIELEDEKQEQLATQIMEQNEVASISRISSMVNSFDDTMKSMNYVVVILIVSAGLLAFVVLYNLSNVNISERIRELATIKVLGFHDKEVYYYVTRETVILTIIGIIFGLIGGYFLSYFIIGTCEINMLRFSVIIKPISYIYAVLITILFTIIVNIVTYFALKKIDMIESLKSVE